jgi:hypothetical protein
VPRLQPVEQVGADRGVVLHDVVAEQEPPAAEDGHVRAGDGQAVAVATSIAT